jgi:hypothetical protein
MTHRRKQRKRRQTKAESAIPHRTVESPNRVPILVGADVRRLILNSLVPSDGERAG